jgi:ATP-dependent Clp protease ATP-binding subunit ClpX
METETEVYRCSFCGKDRSEIGRMIAGPNRVYICNECVELCNQIIAQEDGKGASA